MELEYIKELIKDLAAADGKTYEAYLEEKDIIVFLLQLPRHRIYASHGLIWQNLNIYAS